MSTKKTKIHHSSGFTLIELICVIVILGILSAVAMPRFINLQKDARIAALQGAMGAMQSAAQLVFYRCTLNLVQGEDRGEPGNPPPCDGADGSGGGVTINGAGTKVHTHYKYPSSGDSGMNYAVTLDKNLFDLNHIDGGTYTGYLEVLVKNAPDPSKCKVTYSQATSLGDEPGFKLDTDGC